MNCASNEQTFAIEGRREIVLLQESGGLGTSWPIENSDYELLGPTSDNSPCILLSSRFFKRVSWHNLHEYWSAVQLTLDDECVVMLVSLHLPDRTKCTRDGICLKNIMKCFTDALDAQWLSCSWNVLVMGGDFNTQLPPTGMLGPGVVGGAHRESRTASHMFFNVFVFFITF